MLRTTGMWAEVVYTLSSPSTEARALAWWNRKMVVGRDVGHWLRDMEICQEADF